MLTIQKIFGTGLTILILISCNPTYKLSDYDLSWMPYKGNETLVFSSNSGLVDTIFLIGSMRHIYSRDRLLDPFPPKFERLAVSCKHTDPNYDRYLEGIFVELSASSAKDSANLTIDLTAKNSWFYGGRLLKLKYLDSFKKMTLKTKTKTYSDIIILKPESDEYSDRSNFVKQVYWSKSEGVIRFDKKDSVYWELIKKYGP
jgi:hypothetical protein